MKKTPLFAATALLSVLLVSGLAQARTISRPLEIEAKAATSQATTAEPTVATMDHAPMPADMHSPSQMPMKEMMGKMRGDNKAMMDEMMTKRQELQSILKAPTFDKTAYLAKHEEMQLLHHKMASARAKAFADAAEKMSAEDRAKFAEPMAMMGKRHGGRGQGPGKMGMGMGQGMNPDCPMMGDSAPEAKAKSVTKK